MPTYASARYPKPNDWNEFEDICLSSFKSRWKSPDLQRYGRRGQAQQGVDIYGSDHQGNLVGVQCKNTVKSIERNTIDEEISKAEDFRPTLKKLYIATTADPDAKLQTYVRNLSQSRTTAGKFPVDIVFWDAIVHDLASDPKELHKHYSAFLPPGQARATASSSNRDRDVQALSNLLNVIDIEATHSYLEYAPKYININFLEHTPCFSRITSNPTFHLYDADLQHHLMNWLNQWTNLAGLIRNAPEYELLPSSDELAFKMPGDFISDPKREVAYEKIGNEVPKFFILQNIFCDFVREHFPEIDLSQTSLQARRLY